MYMVLGVGDLLLFFVAQSPRNFYLVFLTQFLGSLEAQHKVAKIINLPHDHIITMMVVVGKKKEGARPRAGQLGLDEVFFNNNF
jgi:hypothetical protein